MNAIPSIQPRFDFFRLTKGKDEVDIAPNTLRKYNRQGLRFYTVKGDRCVYVSRSELENFIRTNTVAATKISTK